MLVIILAFVILFLMKLLFDLLGNKMVVNILDRFIVSGMKNYVPELVEYWTILFETFDKEVKINSFPITTHIIDAYLYQRGRRRRYFECFLEHSE